MQTANSKISRIANGEMVGMQTANSKMQIANSKLAS
jgi:hypothetical protein